MTASVKKPSKQRKMLYESPEHKIRKLLSAPLSEELRANYGRRAYPVCKGDTVKILRGDFAGIEGKVTRVNTDRQRFFIEGVTREKVSGTSTNVSVHSSKVVITKLILDDKWRTQSIRPSEVKPAAEAEA